MFSLLPPQFNGLHKMYNYGWKTWFTLQNKRQHNYNDMKQ